MRLNFFIPLGFSVHHVSYNNARNVSKHRIVIGHCKIFVVDLPYLYTTAKKKKYSKGKRIECKIFWFFLLKMLSCSCSLAAIITFIYSIITTRDKKKTTTTRYLKQKPFINKVCVCIKGQRQKERSCK